MSAMVTIWIFANEAGHPKASRTCLEYSLVTVPSQRLRNSQTLSRWLLDHISLLIRGNSDDNESISVQKPSAGCCRR